MKNILTLINYLEKHTGGDTAYWDMVKAAKQEATNDRSAVELKNEHIKEIKKRANNARMSFPQYLNMIIDSWLNTDDTDI